MKWSPVQLLPLTALIGILCFFTTKSNAQNAQTPNRDDYVLKIKKAKGQITIDGILEEADWQRAEVVGDFYRVLPIDTGYATTPTEVRMSYDDRNLYFGITCFERDEGANIIESLRRDFSFGANDNFLIFIDTYNDQTNGFSFGASAGGAQWDGIQSEGGQVSLDWDCKWESAVYHYADRWNIEMAIPFRNLQFKAGVDEWGINFSRMDVKNNEKSSWTPVPRQFPTANLAFTGTLEWDEAPPRPKTKISLIPYVSTQTSRDYINDQKEPLSLDAGIDAKISLTPSLNLDLTVNPDFSQVDVDEQVTNLDRFELFFPERRRFFLENQDVFTGYGKDGLRPFFSRRIGLTAPVRAGLRLSGKLNEQWRVGILNMQTGESGLIPATNFSVASLQRRVFARSNIGVFFVNKQLTSELETRPDGLADYNRVIGVDYNLASADSRWTGKFFVHKALTPEQEAQSLALSANLNYNTQQWRVEGSYDLVGENYRAESGFVRRTGLHRAEAGLSYRFYPSSERIANHGPSLNTFHIFDPDFKKTDSGWEGAYQISFLDRSELRLSYERLFIRLLDPFDPTNSVGNFLEEGTEYNWGAASFDYESNARRLFNYEATIGYGGFYNGTRLFLESQLNFRFQPYGSISLNLAYNDLQFPAPFQDVDFFLIGPKLDVTLSTSVFFTAFIQYNEQIDNINTNIRLQWRYQPVSDLFIVYSDNYFPSPFNVRNRALVAKVSYWFN
ncbi:MAG TPA: DUF5916 domain-containing protein [Saprospiraceae bacterium]|nr:DUF5916 domain-containing protein [Saprospiraceae bacterium]